MSEHPTAALYWHTVTDGGRGPCLARAMQNVGRCSGRIQAHHVVPRQRLRRELGPEAPVWDVRNGVPLCAHHHHLVTMAVLKLPAALMPAAVFEFAEEYGLGWALERDLEPQEERLFG